jgi:translation initiation factor 3 subunit C
MESTLQVASIVSSMMVRNELAGSWDQPTKTIVIHNVEASRLQKLAGQVIEKATQLVELNERALALRSGSLRTDEDEDGVRAGRRRDWDDGGGFRGSRGRGTRHSVRTIGDAGGDRRRRDGRGRRDGFARRERHGGQLENLGTFWSSGTARAGSRF